jgi:hypothetical protein
LKKASSGFWRFAAKGSLKDNTKMFVGSRDSSMAATGYQWGYRCHLCQWTKRSISHNLMGEDSLSSPPLPFYLSSTILDTEMLLDHGMRQHYITNSAQMAQFSEYHNPSLSPE